MGIMGIVLASCYPSTSSLNMGSMTTNPPLEASAEGEGENEAEGER